MTARNTAIGLLLVSFLSVPTEANAGPTNEAFGKAPPLHDTQESKPEELGAWDDVFVCKNQDFLITRRGDTLFALSMTGQTEFVKLTDNPKLISTHIVSGIQSSDKLWLFLKSYKASPYAVEAHSGNICEFDIPGLNLTASQTPDIQSCILVPNADAALVMVSGGDSKTWPRDGNRPVYFWISLKSGKVVQFPIGWDLDYSSSDQTVAVFDTAAKEPDGRRSLQGIDVKTGLTTSELPDRAKDMFSPYNWEDAQLVKALYTNAPQPALINGIGLFCGISVNGIVTRLDGMKTTPGTVFTDMTTAKANDGFVGFRLKATGSGVAEPSAFWLVPPGHDQKTEHVRDDVIDFSLLGGGTCVLATREHDSYETLVHSYKEATTWNVLDGIESLPKLNKEFTDLGYTTQGPTVRLVDSFGSNDRNVLVACLFYQFRSLALRQYFDPRLAKRPEQMTWRRTVILTSNGQRYMTNILREGPQPDQIWLHNSGIMILGTQVGKETQLSEIKIQVP